MGQAPTSHLLTKDYWKGAELSPWGQRLQRALTFAFRAIRLCVVPDTQEEPSRR